MKLNNGGPGGDPADNQMNWFDLISIKSTSGACIQLDGNDGTSSTLAANTSLNRFGQIQLNIRDNDGFVFGYSDGNSVEMLRVFRPSINTGTGLIFKGDSSNKQKHARHNVVYHYQGGESGATAENGGGVEPSDDNSILGFSYGNTGVDNPPVIEAGATLSYISPRLLKNLASQTVSIDGATDVQLASNALAQIANLTTESHRIFNGSSNHTILADNSGDVWSISVDNATKDVRFSRLSGTGSMDINAPLKQDGV